MVVKAKCAGCLFEGSLRRVQEHHRSCVGFADLYRIDPSLALTHPYEIHTNFYSSTSVESNGTPPTGTLPSSPRPKAKSAGRAPGQDASPPARTPGPVVVEYWDWPLPILEDLQS